MRGGRTFNSIVDNTHVDGTAAFTTGRQGAGFGRKLQLSICQELFTLTVAPADSMGQADHRLRAQELDHDRAT